MRFCFLLPALTLLCSFVEGLNIASFNIQIFGTTKYGKKDVVEVLVRIVRRYDLVLIQEIRDASNTVIHNFLEDVNSNNDIIATIVSHVVSAEGSFAYNVTVSERLGSSNSKEQYAYMYRINKVKIEDAFVISGYDSQFERPPYVALVQPIQQRTRLSPFIVIGVHIRPSAVVAELNALVSVYEDATSHFNIQKALLMGDFNADCSYLSNIRFEGLTLTQDERFLWLIDEDSTVATSVCAYDRFVAAGGFEQYLMSNASVFYFDAEYGLANELTTAVSDHYPIKVQLLASRSSCALVGVKYLQVLLLAVSALLSAFFLA